MRFKLYFAIICVIGLLTTVTMIVTFGGVEQKATSVETVDQQNWRLGKKGSIFYYGHNIGPTGSFDIVIFTKNKNIMLESIEISGSSGFLTFWWHSNPTVTYGTGERIQEIKSNETVDFDLGVEFYLNPTVIDYGSSTFDGIDVPGYVANTSFYDMKSKVLDNNMAIKSNSIHILKFQNKHLNANNVNIGIRIIFTVM